jgi:type IV conjugative transfer system protein TraL
MKPQRFPRYLTAPIQVLWMEADDLAVIAFGYMMGILIGFVGFSAMVIFPVIYARLKKRYPRGFMKHALYFIGFLELRGYPTFFEKEFTE